MSTPDKNDWLFGRRGLIHRAIDGVKHENPDLSGEQLQEVESHLTDEIAEMPPIAIGLIGEAGVGKTSTINSLFSTDLEVGHAVAGTKQPRWLDVDLGERGWIRVLDMPGLGESIEADTRYTQMYFEELPRLDVLVWVIAAEHRAMRPIQEALKMLAEQFGASFTDRLVLALNKVDLIHPGPGHWQEAFNLPSEEQRGYLAQRIDAVFGTIRDVLPDWKGQLVAYSADRRWQLEDLLNAMLTTAPELRGWLLSKQAAVRDFEELIDPRIRRLVEERRRHRAQ